MAVNVCLHRSAAVTSMRKLMLGLTLLSFATACRSGQGSASRPEQGGRDPYLILASELEAAGRDNLYDAVRQLRPGWFTRPNRQSSGESSIVVYLQDRQMGSVTALRNFPARSVESVRYLSPTEAQVRYGQSNLGRPAIQIEMSRSP
jgi:hypothetical protein